MRRSRSLAVPVIAVLFAFLPVFAHAGAPPLVPLDTLLGPPDVLAPRLSPDGTLLSWLAPVDGAMNLWLAPATDAAQARPVTRETGRGLQAFDVSGNVLYRWTADSRRLLYPKDSDGDEKWNWWCLDVATGRNRLVTPRPGAEVRLLALDERRPDLAMVGINDRDPRLHDLWRLDLSTDSLTPVRENPGVAAWMVDGSLTPRLVAAVDGGAVWVLALDDTGGMRPLYSTARGESPGRLLGFSPDGRTAWSLSARDRDRQALVETTLPAGTARVLAEDARVDVGDALRDPVTGRPQAYMVEWTRREWKALEPGIATDLGFLRSAEDGDFEVLSRSRDDRRWLVKYTLSDRPERYVLYERPERRIRPLFVSKRALEGMRFPRLHDAVILSRDSLALVSYWSVPLESDPDGDGIPSRPLPMVMLVHGGPGDERAEYGFYPFLHWLTSRGYAVMSVNFRGSPGFGRAFQMAERLEWGGKMNLDLVDQVRWAVDRGIARADRVGAMGGSYGGYAVLAALTFTPGVFACGVDVVGPADLETFMSTLPPTWSLDHLAARIGDPRTEEGRAHLRARSPIHFADRVRVPVLIGQGANDSRVPQGESDRMVDALVKAGSRVTYAVFSDEGHGFLRSENDRAFWAVTEGFLAAALGGRCAPIGDALQGSSIRVPVGAAHVRGLEDALRRLPPR
jgi:dipeptidyl aminopeptidase/acylaminoacyl peptidase